MPGSPRKLIVVGEIEVPTTGWKASLKPAVPQGINPAELILDLDLTKPSGAAGDKVSTIEARYEEAPPKHPYTSVMVREHGHPAVTVAVKSTS